MAYNSNVWWPSSYYPQSTPSLPMNGLVRVESVEEAKNYSLAPNSVSPPLFLASENAFIIKKTDEFGVSSFSKYSFAEEPFDDQAESGEFVTREYFDSQMSKLMEAINGQHSVSEQPAKTEDK